MVQMRGLKSHEVSGITLRFPKLTVKWNEVQEKLRGPELRGKITVWPVIVNR